MPWTPRTPPTSSSATTTPTPALPAPCSASGTSWPQPEGSLRIWRCWWVPGGVGAAPGGQGGPKSRWGSARCVQGGAVGVHVRWDCDLDSRGADCRPQYSFQLQERSYNFRCGPTAPAPAGPQSPGCPRLGGWSPGPPAQAPSSLHSAPPLPPGPPAPSLVLPPAFPPPRRGFILLFPLGFILKSSKVYRRVQRLVP